MDTPHQPTTNTPATGPRVLLTVEAAAKALSIGRTSMYALIKDGEVTSVRIGHLRRVPVDALTAYVAQLTSNQAQAA
jgi:excisionase family DNA binding protein